MIPAALCISTLAVSLTASADLVTFAITGETTLFTDGAGVGFSIPDGPFAYKSERDAVPLSELEQMVLLTAVAGNTGWQYLIPHNPNYSPEIPNYSAAAGGRIRRVIWPRPV